MTYSPAHVTDDHRLSDLLGILDRDMSELRQMTAIYGDAMDLPGRRSEVDPDRTGRQATHGPSRPTEVLALDESRALMRTAAANGVARVVRAIALVRGSVAEMDRALQGWEGVGPQGSTGNMGSAYGCADGPADVAGAA